MVALNRVRGTGSHAALNGGSSGSRSRVNRIAVTPGEHVRADQPLLYIASPDYSLMRSAYIKARDALQLADKVFKRLGVELSFVDMTDPRRVEAALRPTTRLLWTETPTNPMLKIVDLAAVAEICKKRGISGTN